MSICTYLLLLQSVMSHRLSAELQLCKRRFQKALQVWLFHHNHQRISFKKRGN